MDKQGLPLAENSIWLMFLDNLQYRQIITLTEKEMLLAEFAVPEIFFKVIGAKEISFLIKVIREHLGMEPRSLNYQTEKFFKSVAYKGSWLNIKSYADKESRAIMFFIYVLIAAYVET